MHASGLAPVCEDDLPAIPIPDSYQASFGVTIVKSVNGVLSANLLYTSSVGLVYFVVQLTQASNGKPLKVVSVSQTQQDLESKFTFSVRG